MMNNLKFEEYILIDFNTDGDDCPINDIDTEIINAYKSHRYDSNTEIYKHLNKKYVATKGDVIYFDSECNVPRFKLKPFCDKYGVSITKTPDKANVKFISSDSINKKFDKAHYYILERGLINDILNNVLVKDTETYIRFKSVLESYPNTDVIVDSYYTINDHDLIKPYYKKYYSDEQPKHAYYITKREDAEKAIDIFDPQIFPEDEILKYINQDNVMDEESYKTVCALFESSDDGNHMLAMEIMANCDFKRSAVYLLMLFEDYNSKISDSPSRKHVNFKSFMKFFNLSTRSRFRMSDIINTLKICKLATPENIQQVIAYKNKDLLSSECEDHFVVNAIVPNEEVKESIKESIIDVAVENNVSYCETDIDTHVNNLVFKI